MIATTASNIQTAKQRKNIAARNVDFVVTRNAENAEVSSLISEK